MIRRLAIHLIIVLHVLSTFFLIFGFLLPKAFLPIHFLSIPLTLFQWWANDSQCILTQWQHQLSGQKNIDEQELQGEFTRQFFKSLGLHLKDRHLALIIYSALIVSLLCSLFRYFY